MSRRYRRRQNREQRSTAKPISGYLTIVFGLALLFSFQDVKSAFYLVLFLAVIPVALWFFIKTSLEELHRRRIAIITEKLKSDGLQTKVIDYFNQWDAVGVRDEGLISVGCLHISEDKLAILIEELKKRGYDYSVRELLEAMREIVANNERELTVLSLSDDIKPIQDFNSLSGLGFEKLLMKLYRAMGYEVRHLGQTGDQGGDLIAVKDDVGLLIQAKCYSGNVGNKAVQEVAAARLHYKCQKAAVVASADFTKEAVDLAASNGVALIGKDHLKRMLLEYLKESWR